MRKIRGIALEVGVQGFAPFTGNNHVICSSTPSGLAGFYFIAALMLS
jgi:hypothetical protein